MSAPLQTRGLITLLKNRLNRADVYTKADYWDAKAREHSGDAVSMWPNPHLNALYSREQAAMLDRFLPKRSGLRVLDVGCGSGRMSRLLAARGATVLGIDFSPETVSVARRSSEGPNPTYALGSVYDLAGFGQFDVATVFGVLTVACRDRDQLIHALRQIRGVLGKDGTLVLWEPIHHSFLHRVLKLNLTDFILCLKEAGLEVVECRPMHFWPTRLALCYVKWPSTLTKAVYWLGQQALGLTGLRGGDYKVIVAKPVAS